MGRKGARSAADTASALALAFVLNLNSVTTVWPSQSNLLTALIFLAFFVTVLASNSKIFSIRLHIPLAITISLYVLWSLFSFILYDANYYRVLLKFLICIIVAYLAGWMHEEAIITAFNVAIVLSSVFSLYAIARYRYIYNTLIVSGEGNRLTITLPIGLGLMLALVNIIIQRGAVFKQLLYIAAAIVQILALFNYDARGNLIFALAVFVVMIIFDSMANKRVMIRNLLLLFAGIIIFLVMFRQYASVSMIYRMNRLFQATEDEVRIPIYKFYLNDIWRHYRFAIGSGLGRSVKVFEAGGFTERYPHNFALELIGEGGVFGIALILAALIEIIRAERQRLISLKKTLWDRKNLEVQLFFLLNGGLLFYALNYAKSYSIYDGYQLFIFIAMILATDRLGKREAGR